MANSFMKSLYAGYAAREKGNLREAFECFQNALEAEKGSPIAAYEVGWYYEQGELVPQDLEKAHQLYTQAAEGCVEKAQARLAEWHDQGIYVEKNAEKAKFWRERAKKQEAANETPPISIAESIRQTILESQEYKEYKSFQDKEKNN